MKILKTTNVEGNKAKYIFQVFDDCVLSLRKLLAFENIQLHVSSEDSIKVDGNNLVVLVDYHNAAEGDRLKAFLLQQLGRAAIRKNVFLPQFLEEIFANRTIIKEGYGDSILYFYFYRLAGMKSTESLEVDVPWLSFYGLDDYVSELFLEMKDRIEHRNVFESGTIELLKRCVKNNDVRGALDACKDVIECKS